MLARLFLLLWLLATPVRGDTPLLVFAAASLAGPLDAIAEAWDGGEEGGEVVISYAGSSILARQITAGARADVVILANRDWADHLINAGAVEPGAVQEVLGNQLALVTRPNGDGVPQNLLFPVQLSALPEGARIATGLVDAVPVGIYARQALESIGQYDALRDQLVQVENARVALALAGRGDVDAALIYRSDAQADPRVHVLALVAPELHEPIVYPAAPLATSTHPGTDGFLDHLLSPASLDVFRDAGFALVRE